ncbi:MAG: hypothetical protein ABSG41_24775 [Bryobacteraceae bacterium]
MRLPIPRLSALFARPLAEAVSRPDETPRLTRWRVTALFAHVWPTLRRGVAGRHVLPSWFSGVDGGFLASGVNS